MDLDAEKMNATSRPSSGIKRLLSSTIILSPWTHNERRSHAELSIVQVSDVRNAVFVPIPNEKLAQELVAG